MNATPTPSLRAALQLALAVARRGEQDWPAVPAPARLRPYLGFAKAPNAALELCRRVVDEDEAFRRRVAAEATADQVGSVGWLWLTRPDGWEASIAELQARAERARAEDGTARHRDELARRQAAAREALEHSERARRTLAADLDEARAELAEQQRQVREARSALLAAESELARVDADRAALLRRLKQAEALVARHGAELRALHTDHEALQQSFDAQAEELEKHRSARHDPATRDGDGDGEREHLDPPGRQGVRGRERAPGPDHGTGASPALRAAIDAASRAAAALAEALGEAATALDGENGTGTGRGAGEPERTDSPVGRRAAAPGATSSNPAARPARPAVPARRPLRMPPGTFDDTDEAAEHLVRVPHVLFLVDGYNVAKQGWPDLELRLQRDRLVEALVALQARTGARTDVVFDGVDDGQLQVRAAPGRLRVEFTSTDVEADDRLLELVELTPLGRPVVVVSTDRRVRDGARRRGANTLSSQQLLRLLR